MFDINNLKYENCAAIAIDCLNTFMKPNGNLSLSTFQSQAKGLNKESVQHDIDESAKRMGELRNFLFSQKVPQIQFQDAHVIESIHGRRFHSLEIARDGEEADFIRTFPPHALLKRNRQYGTDDQQAIEEIYIKKSKQVFIRWFETHMPLDATLEPDKELIFLKDDFCMVPGSPFLDQLFWELRRQGRFNLITFGVCDEICNLRNVLLMLSGIFNVVYVHDCTYPLEPEKREVAIQYMKKFNPLGSLKTGQFITATSTEVMNVFGKSGSQ